MKSASEALARRTLLAAAVCVLAPGAVLAQGARPHAITTAANFDAAVWERLLRQGPRPAAYVFTTTYCPTYRGLNNTIKLFATPDIWVFLYKLFGCNTNCFLCTFC